MTWRPYLPEPRPAFRFDVDDPEPVEIAVLRDLRDLCANFHVPPRHFRSRVGRRLRGSYQSETDTVAVDPRGAAANGMGGEDGYYAVLLHELLHATGHSSRLGRATIGDYSLEGYELEEGTVLEAQRIVLETIGFEGDALEWHGCGPEFYRLPVARAAAEEAAGWVLQGRANLKPRNRDFDNHRRPVLIQPEPDCRRLSTRL